MSVRQYIGARYVTKIYENSLDPSSAEWESGVTYEPLTLVTYLNGSYLSKKEVPGNIGNPAANPTYWVVTGAYNGQIAQLENRISNVESEMQGFGKFSTRKVIAIGDSYAEAPSVSDNWCEYFGACFDFASYEYFAYSGKGFCTNSQNSILTSFQAETISDPDEITDIVCCCGINDVSTILDSEWNDLLSNIADFISYCNTTYPNAQVYIGFNGNVIYGSTYAGSFSSARLKKTISHYIKATTTNGAHYLKGLELVLHNVSLLASDQLHPTTDGAKLLGQATAEAFADGSFNYITEQTAIIVDTVSGVSINGNTTGVDIGTAQIDNNITQISLKGLNITFGAGMSFGVNSTRIANMSPGLVSANDTEILIQATVQANTDINQGNYINVPVLFVLKNGALRMASQYMNSGVFETHTFYGMYVSFDSVSVSTLNN